MSITSEGVISVQNSSPYNLQVGTGSNVRSVAPYSIFGPGPGGYPNGLFIDESSSVARLLYNIPGTNQFAQYRSDNTEGSMDFINTPGTIWVDNPASPLGRLYWLQSDRRKFYINI